MAEIRGLRDHFHPPLRPMRRTNSPRFWVAIAPCLRTLPSTPVLIGPFVEKTTSITTSGCIR